MISRTYTLSSVRVVVGYNFELIWNHSLSIITQIKVIFCFEGHALWRSLSAESYFRFRVPRSGDEMHTLFKYLRFKSWFKRRCSVTNIQFSEVTATFLHVSFRLLWEEVQHPWRTVLLYKYIICYTLTGDGRCSARLWSAHSIWAEWRVLQNVCSRYVNRTLFA